MISYERAREIAELYYNDVYQLCLLRLRKEEDAADVAQEVFLFFQEHCDDLDDAYIKTWLYSVANRKIKEEFRKIAKREKQIIFGKHATYSNSTELVYEMNIDNFITDEEIEKKKNSIIASLTKKELELFEMFYIKHMEYEEIANTLDITNNAVRTRVSRLKNKLKERASYIFMAILLIFMKF